MALAAGAALAGSASAEPVRVAIVEIPAGKTRYGDIPEMPLTAFLNPTIEVVDPAARGYWEGCLSVPGLRGFVERPQHVRVRYTTLEGASAQLELQGFLATVFQHELDHLDGTLYVDRIKDPKLLAFEEEFTRYLAPQDAGDVLE